MRNKKTPRRVPNAMISELFNVFTYSCYLFCLLFDFQAW